MPLNSLVTKIDKKPDGYNINNQEFDYCILATDVKHIKPLVENSPSLKQYSGFNKKMEKLGHSDRYAVLRLWTTKFENSTDLPFFIFTDRLKCLDSITLYHKMEKTSEEWSKQNNGGIFELHCYSLPQDLNTEEEIATELMRELFHFMPELKEMKIVHSYFQQKQDFAAFHVGLHENRPTINTEVPNLYLAGDWVKMDNCTMLMEAAFTSGSIAANEIFKKEGLRENKLVSVPVKGILA